MADWNGERAQLDNRMTSERISASRNNAGAAIEHQFLVGRLSTTMGVRVERNDSFGTAAVPRASAVYTLRSGHGVFGDTRLRGAAGAGIKEPTLLQTFSISPYYLGNPDLQPERSRSVEAGVEQRLAGDRAKLSATWFDNRYRNIIGLRPTGGYNSQYFNIGLTRARGLETGADVAVTTALHVSGGYTFTDSAILQSTSDYSPVFAVGQWAFRRPRHAGFVGATFTRQRLTADVQGHLIGRFVDSDFSSLVPAITGNPGHTTWDAHASWRLRTGLTALVSVDNLTNRNYQ